MKTGDQCLDCPTGLYRRMEEGENENVFHLKCGTCGMGAYFPKDGGPYPPCCSQPAEKCTAE